MSERNNNKDSILKITREAKGLTLEIVHEATKIPMDVLKAIEEGYSVRIITPFYYRGFIKIYAEFLGLDVAETYKHYNIDAAPKQTSSAALAVKNARQASVPNAALEQMQEWFFSFFNPKHIKGILKFIGVLFVLFLFFRIGGCMISHLHHVSQKPKAHQYVGEKNTASLPVAVKREVVRAQSENHKVEVALRAMHDTWIQVKADDRVVFQMTLNKGSMESWSAQRHIELAGRNLGQLDMEVNGKHIGTLESSGGRKIRRVFITSEGLTVKR